MEQTIQTVIADDGSTSIKLAWFEGSELNFLNVSNAAEIGAGFTDESAAVFSVVGGQSFNFYDSADAIKTKSDLYQYDDHSVSSIHYALSLAGFSGKDVEVVATLPLSQFYKLGRPNQINIDNKKENILKKVTAEFNDVANIVSVKVYPEGIPAVFPLLVNEAGAALVDDDELTFLADMGGTTLDLCLFSGANKKLIKAESHDLGMFKAFDKVRHATNSLNARDMVIKKLLETGEARGGKISIDREAVTAELMSKAANLIIDFLDKDKGELSNCFCIGGGAELLALQLIKNDLNPVVVENPVEALARSIAKIENNKKG